MVSLFYGGMPLPTYTPDFGGGGLHLLFLTRLADLRSPCVCKKSAENKIKEKQGGVQVRISGWACCWGGLGGCTCLHFNLFSGIQPARFANRLLQHRDRSVKHRVSPLSPQTTPVFDYPYYFQTRRPRLNDFHSHLQPPTSAIMPLGDRAPPWATSTRGPSRALALPTHP